MNLGSEYSNYSKSKIVILPVEYEGTVTYGKGCSKAPSAILKASNELEPYDEETCREVCFDAGIATLEPIKDSNDIHEVVYKKIKKIIEDDKFVVLIGGEHSISFEAVKALKEKYEKMSVLQFDAHADLKFSFEGSQFNHACAARRIFPFCNTLVQFGVRSLDIDEHKFIEENKDKIHCFFAKDIYNDDSWMDKAIEALDENVYVSIDVDGFDCFINSGTPEPGGLNWFEVMKFLRKVSEKRKIVGFDVVEMIPKEDKDGYICAKLVYKLMNYVFS